MFRKYLPQMKSLELLPRTSECVFETAKKGLTCTLVKASLGC